MTFPLIANRKTYTVSDHAAERMIQRFISEPMIVETLEHGAVIEQEHGIDLYEHQIDDGDEWLIIQVAVDEEKRVIVTVIDGSQPKSE